MFRKILIANRGEIACRIARTCRRLGVAIATVHSEADRNALHVREIGESIEIGPAPASSSYLAIDKILRAARRVGAEAVHPGYGFLAENAAFATALEQAGLAFIGPSPDVLARFGDKAAAKAEARRLGIPVVPGTLEPTDRHEQIVAATAAMRYPLMLKAAAGGGGKGMRVVSSAETLHAHIEAAIREARGAFGDGRIIIEEFLPKARHIEVQVLGDGDGHVVHLFDRECSLQRRHQKIIEEAPVVSLRADMREEIFHHAVKLASAVRYRGLGTVEFIVKDERLYFLEVNPRIQVEHPVTEEITGLDLVELQLRAVADGRLPITQSEIRSNGFAVEARVCAEDPQNRFLPSTGRIEGLRFPDTVRIDAGVDARMRITPHYDSMIAKVIDWGANRGDCYRRLATALRNTSILGVKTNLAFLQTLIENPRVVANDIHTGTVDELAADAIAGDAPTAEEAAIAAGIWLRESRLAAQNDVWNGWSKSTSWRLGIGVAAVTAAPSIRLECDGLTYEIRFGHTMTPDVVAVEIAGVLYELTVEPVSGESLLITVNDRSLMVTAVVTSAYSGFAHGDRSVRFAVEPYLSGALLRTFASTDGFVRAPMMGRIVAVNVMTGQRVNTGDRLAVMESMKMELGLHAPFDGMVAQVNCRADATLERDAVAFVITAVTAAEAS